MDTPLFTPSAGPAVPEVDGVQPANEREPGEQRQEKSLLDRLRNMLRQNNREAASSSLDGADRYEPQRLTRKIHWQYDGHAHKVPMLRRPYI